MYILIGKSQLCCDSENKLLLGDHHLFLIENTASIYQLQDFVPVGYRFLTMQETLAYMHDDLASPGTCLHRELATIVADGGIQFFNDSAEA